MKVLIVDDDRLTRLALSQFLCVQGVDILTANNDAEALHLIKQHKINIIIIDWLMPIMNGLQLVRAIRTLPHDISSYIYIIILTDLNKKDAIIKGIRAGADECLFKSTKKEELYLRICAAQSILEFKEKKQHKLEKKYKEISIDYEKICTELKRAAKVQESMLPQKGKMADFVFDWLFYPCSDGYVAGDVFNYFRINKNYLGFYQIDVAGHGISAALLSVSLYHQMTGSCMTGSCRDVKSLVDINDTPLPPSQVIMRLNRDFQSPDVSQYFTIVYGYIENATGKVCLSQAGHPPALYITADGNLEQIDIKGFPVGMFSDVEYMETEFHMEPGARLFIYSDGVIACKNTDNIFFSEQRLKDILQENNHLALPNLFKTLKNSIKQWHDSSQLPSFKDDTSLMAIEYHNKENGHTGKDEHHYYS
ncbi:MAG: fused response regulator/phosphatase [Candidatus Electrothrix sp. AR3]|nr:fused response regulator/phosphatase [Candidatus Electrothrix sp. AR3]